MQMQCKGSSQVSIFDKATEVGRIIRGFLQKLIRNKSY